MKTLKDLEMIVKDEKGDPNEAQKVLQKSYAGTSAIIKCY